MQKNEGGLKMNLVGRTAKLAWWLAFGKMKPEHKKRLLTTLEFIAKEGKDFFQYVELKATKDGVTLQYRRQF